VWLREPTDTRDEAWRIAANIARLPGLFALQILSTRLSIRFRIRIVESLAYQLKRGAWHSFGGKGLLD
jgi:hypothetical protein